MWGLSIQGCFRKDPLRRQGSQSCQACEELLPGAFRVRDPSGSETLAHSKLGALISQVRNLDYKVTDNEVEALLLECNLIKEYHPRYNVSLKDDKRYPYLKMTKEDFPRIFVTRKVKIDGAKYFGP